MSDSPYIINIDEADFEARVIQASHQQPVLVDFWADWCSPCRVIAPQLAMVIPEYEGRVLLAKIDADENMKLAGRYKLRGFPTIILFINGEEVDRFGGAKPAQGIREFLDQHVS
ncbi:MAG: thioredoxin [Chromatiales bacterium]|nr:thioredoxin [Gammaproteobacteria bacterium]MBW6476160.1 thioredoxin [Chromatiales bacterium]